MVNERMVLRVETVLLIVAVLCVFALIFYLGHLSAGLNKKIEKFYAGNFVVDFSDPLKDIFTVELTCAIGEITEHDELYFRIINKGSQEKPLV